MGIKPKDKNPMGYYLPTDLEMKASYWCIENGVGVSPLRAGYGKGRWHVEITINKKSKKSPETYGKVEIWKKTYEFRLYYYNKFLKKQNEK